MRNGDKLIGDYNFRTAPLGAGGFVTGCIIRPTDGRMIHWTDVFNLYERGPLDREWRLLLRTDNMPLGEYDFAAGRVNNTGDVGGCGAWMVGTRTYAAWNGHIYRRDTDDGMFSRTAFGPRKLQSNHGAQRRFNSLLAGHPTNPDILLVGSNDDGVRYTLDGGATWADALSGGNPLPPPLPHSGDDAKKTRTLVAIDQANPDNCYAAPAGRGLYRSTNGLGGDFQAVPGGPLTTSCLVVAHGKVWMTEFRGSGNNLWRLDGSTWTQMANSAGADQVAVDPFDEGHFVVVDENGGSLNQFYNGVRQPYGRNSAATPQRFEWRRGDGEIPWFSNTVKQMFPAQLVFDPRVQGKIWVCEGIGISWATCTPPGHVPSNSDPWLWHDYSRGNEELVGTCGVSPPGEPLKLGCMDKAVWNLKRPAAWANQWSTVPLSGATINGSEVSHCRSIDFAIDEPRWLAATLDHNGTVRNGFSANGGDSWSPFPTQPTLSPGGTIAVSTKNNIVVCPANRGDAKYTKDGGATWNPVVIGGNANIDWNFAAYIGQRCVAADKSTPGRFMALVPAGEAANTGLVGVWVTEDGGDTWTQKLSGAPGGAIFGPAQHQVKYVPGFAGEAVWAYCSQGPGDSLYLTQDNGAHWTRMNTGVSHIQCWDFGKAAPGQTRPTIFFHGTVGGVNGFYVSIDWMATVTLVEQFPNKSFDSVGRGTGIVGDMNVFGRAALARSGSGWSLLEHTKEIVGL